MSYDQSTNTLDQISPRTGPNTGQDPSLKDSNLGTTGASNQDASMTSSMQRSGMSSQGQKDNPNFAQAVRDDTKVVLSNTSEESDRQTGDITARNVSAHKVPEVA